MTMTKELISNFEKYLIEEEKSCATIEKYLRDVTVFFKWLAGSEVDKMTVLHYKEYLTGNYAPSSVNSVLSSLNTFFEFNEWHSLKVKMLKIQRQIFASKDKELTKAEYERLLDAAKHKKNERLYYLMQTICASGIRVSELKAVTVEAVRARKATIKCKGQDACCNSAERPLQNADGICKRAKNIKRSGVHHENRKTA